MKYLANYYSEKIFWILFFFKIKSIYFSSLDIYHISHLSIALINYAQVCFPENIWRNEGYFSYKASKKFTSFDLLISNSINQLIILIKHLIGGN